MMDVTRGTRGEVIVRLDGTFDAKAATRLAGCLTGVGTGEKLVLDFGGVREFQDLGLAAVAGELAERKELVVYGLTRHHERMLRYFGVNLPR